MEEPIFSEFLFAFMEVSSHISVLRLRKSVTFETVFSSIPSEGRGMKDLLLDEEVSISAFKEHHGANSPGIYYFLVMRDGAFKVMRWETCEPDKTEEFELGTFVILGGTPKSVVVPTSSFV